MSDDRCPHGILRGGRIKCPSCDRKVVPELPKDLTGFRIGKLVCQKMLRTAHGTQFWECVCDCRRVVEMSRKGIRKAQVEGFVSACPDCRAYTKSKEVA